jgi:hypothetical protein
MLRALGAEKLKLGKQKSQGGGRGGLRELLAADALYV